MSKNEVFDGFWPFSLERFICKESMAISLFDCQCVRFGPVKSKLVPKRDFGPKLVPFRSLF